MCVCVQALDNPDQRICDDVRAYAAPSVMLSVSIMRKLFICVAFAGRSLGGERVPASRLSTAWLR